MTLRFGITTGTCAAAAARACAMLIAGEKSPASVAVELPEDNIVQVEILHAEKISESVAQASVRKIAGDDPDVTDGSEVVVRLEKKTSGGLEFSAGEGVGTVTLPGLQVAVGQPAINPGPRKIIAKAISEFVGESARITISIPGGDELARETFNPKLGIVGGLSILGTTGIVRPFCHKAMLDAIRCELQVANASSSKLVLVPGNIGRICAEQNFEFQTPELVEVGNDWDFAFSCIDDLSFDAILVVGHAGKLAKFIDGYFQTHSAKSPPALMTVKRIAKENINYSDEKNQTVEGFFADLPEQLETELPGYIASAILQKIQLRFPQKQIALVLVNMKSEIVATAGEVEKWKP